MSGPTLTQLRRWKRKLDRAHTEVCAVAAEAEQVFADDPETVILIEDPLIELHVALGVVEHLIEEHPRRSA